MASGDDKGQGLLQAERESDAEMNDDDAGDDGYGDTDDDDSYGDIDEDDEDDDEEADENIAEANDEQQSQSVKKTYVPNSQNQVKSDKLNCDQSAYIVYHKAESGFPCLSFDVIEDNLDSGPERVKTFPLSLHLVSGTQAPQVHVNYLLLMRMSNLHSIRQKANKMENEEDDDEESSSDCEDEVDQTPQLEFVKIPHNGAVNRLRCTSMSDKVVAASWSDLGFVNIWDLTMPLHAVDNKDSKKMYNKCKDKPLPIYSFAGHRVEGYGLDWSPVCPGQIATGDCNKNIHIWKPTESFTWIVDQQPLIGHEASVEDINWSPNEPNVLASCSVDKSIRIWDIRARPASSCMITVAGAHESDINVISWNRSEAYFLLSGGDDGVIRTWDMRQFGKDAKPQPLATFKHHTGPITSIEWHPSDSTVFAASGEDNQVSLWDLAVEKDDDEEEEDDDLKDLPPQLLFIHQGQTEIKEIHWHKQMPGLLISTAINGFDVFRTISV